MVLTWHLVTVTKWIGLTLWFSATVCWGHVLPVSSPALWASRVLRQRGSKAATSCFKRSFRRGRTTLPFSPCTSHDHTNHSDLFLIMSSIQIPLFQRLITKLWLYQANAHRLYDSCLVSMLHVHSSSFHCFVCFAFFSNWIPCTRSVTVTING